MKWTLTSILEATNGELHRTGELKSRESIEFLSIETDTRTLNPGALFVAIKGENFDGHDFVTEAINKGARGIIFEDYIKISQLIEKFPDVPFVGVKSTRKALGDLALFRRKLFNGSVVAITGSNGKTSTKEMTALVLSAKFQVFKTPHNWNNDIGVPLSVFQISDNDDIAVLELGINHTGEMRELARVALPDVGLITNVQPAHLEGLSSEDKVLEEKVLLWDNLSDNGVIVTNFDDARLMKRAEATGKKIISFGMGDGADVHAKDISITMEGTEFTVEYNGERERVSFSAYGQHHVLNALAAIAVGTHFGVSLIDVAHKLSGWSPVSHRMQKIELSDGTVIFDDCYNANPGSMQRAIETVSHIAFQYNRPFVAVVGDMKELGDNSVAFHEQIGEKLAASPVKSVISIGEFGKVISEKAKQKRSDMQVFSAETHEGIVDWLKSNWIEGAVILFKASRSMTLEKAIEPLIQWKGKVSRK